MPPVFTCPRGHPWDGTAAPQPAGSTVILCPVCGEPLLQHQEMAPANTGADTILDSTQVAALAPRQSEAPPCNLPLASLCDSAEALHLPGQGPAIPGYEILGVLGHGGMGVVYKARQLGLKRLVALKMVLGGRADPAGLARFQREAEAVAQMQHPHIVRIYEIGTYEHRPFFSMELIEGGSLARRLAKEALPLRQAAELVEVLAHAIHYAHLQGIIHRDLKPANILLGADGLPRITDFGLAKRFDPEPGSSTVEPGPTRTGEILGTPNYMAPEQAAGLTREATPAADIYSLGAILYQLLTDRPPFSGATPLETILHVLEDEPIPPSVLQPRVPRDLQTICLTCLHKDPSRRYATAEALAEDLRRFLAGEPIRARPVGRWERLLLWIRRRPLVALLAGVGGIALFGLLAGAWFYSAFGVSAGAVLSLLGAAWWYSARLKAAVARLDRQHLVAERNVERLHLLLETTRLLMAVTTLDELLRLLSETTTRLANAERATIYLTDWEKKELWSKVALGDGVGEIRVPLGTGIAGTVALTGETINLADPYADPRFNQEIDRRTGYRTRNLLTFPMAARDGRILGVFQVLNKRSGAFAEEDVEILRALSLSAALAVEKADSSQTAISQGDKVTR